MIHPRSVVVGVDARAIHADEALAARIDAALDSQGLARLALAAIVAPASAIGDGVLEEAAQTLDVPLRAS